MSPLSSVFAHLEQKAEMPDKGSELAFEVESEKVRMRIASSLYDNSAMDSLLCRLNKTNAEDLDCSPPFSDSAVAASVIAYIYHT
jgi:hypothetical protein